jgi:UDP-glucuronate 4-epimerase
MKRYLVTGVAGFIGAHVAAALLRAGHEVVGVDSINDYYDPLLKRYRLGPLLAESHFSFVETDLADALATEALFAERPFHVVIHLAAQAGVRYSLQNPGAYVQSNLVGFQHVIDGCCAHPPEHLVFASSSSVYGNSDREWLSESDVTDHPVSLYAATKKSNEVMAHTVAHLHG